MGLAAKTQAWDYRRTPEDTCRSGPAEPEHNYEDGDDQNRAIKIQRRGTRGGGLGNECWTIDFGLCLLKQIHFVSAGMEQTLKLLCYLFRSNSA